MSLQKILKELETGRLPRVLFVHGPETKWHDSIYSVLREHNAKDSLADFNWSVFYGSKDFELEPLLLELGMVPWGDGKKIVVLRDAELVPAATMEKIASWLQENPGSNNLAIFLSKVDGRLKYVKILRQFAVEVECTPLQEGELVRYVLDSCTQEGKKMQRDTAHRFIDTVGTDLLVAQNELEKLFAFTAGRAEITPSDIKAISSLAPGQVVDRTIFEMTDFIVQKKRHEALEVLNRLIVAGEPALRILPLIERQLRLVLAAKTATTNLETAAKQMGESNPYPLKKVEKQAKNYNFSEIFSGFEAVLHADKELKLGGNGQQVLTDLIVKLT